jgi:hypothetical protein
MAMNSDDYRRILDKFADGVPEKTHPRVMDEVTEKSVEEEMLWEYYFDFVFPESIPPTAKSFLEVALMSKKYIGQPDDFAELRKQFADCDITLQRIIRIPVIEPEKVE